MNGEMDKDFLYCYELRVFSESTNCPALDSTITTKPKCIRYGKLLSWTRSGKILKCEECESNHSTPEAYREFPVGCLLIKGTCYADIRCQDCNRYQDQPYWKIKEHENTK
jgi:hypothetical protein